MIVNLFDGAKFLLFECLKILESEQVNYMIVGGWSPFFFNNGPIPHPGTKDVDILFETGYTENALKNILEKFIKRDFKYSAKNQYQLLREYLVAKKKFIYNVDLIHPVHSLYSQEFVNHLDIPVEVSVFVNALYALKTVSMPGGAIFFQEFKIRHKTTFKNEKGREEQIEFNIISEPGLIFSKCKSFLDRKRDRDAFDIYITISQCSNYSKMIETFLRIKVSYPKVFNSLTELYNTIMAQSNKYKKLNEVFCRNVQRFITAEKYNQLTCSEILFPVEKFFVDIRFDE